MSDLAIYTFHWDCGRMGELDGVFLRSKKDVEDVIGKRVYFGEVLGKHSEIDGILEEGDITLVTDEQEAIDLFRKYPELEVGYDPLSYLADEEEDEDESSDD